MFDASSLSSFSCNKRQFCGIRKEIALSHLKYNIKHLIAVLKFGDSLLLYLQDECSEVAANQECLLR